MIFVSRSSTPSLLSAETCKRGRRLEHLRIGFQDAVVLPARAGRSALLMTRSKGLPARFRADIPSTGRSGVGGSATSTMTSGSSWTAPMA